MRRVLAIETSCDDTSLAIVREDGFVEGLASANQDLVHEPFGGVVPEIASRNHTLAILPLIAKVFEKSGHAWDSIDGIVVTSRPGLVGSLLVGLVTAKTLALAKNKPLVGVNHLEGHLLAPLLRDASYAPPEGFTYPYVGLAISGGHTNLYLIEDFARYRMLGSTVDDAAGEAFDKFAKMLNLGYPGGVKVDQYARNGNPRAFEFPRPMLHEKHLQMSFSGLKTAALRVIEKLDEKSLLEQRDDLCASYQEAIAEILVAKLAKAVKQHRLKRGILTGGVSANSRVRELATKWAQESKVELVIPPLRYCTDNAAMIGYAGVLRLIRGQRDDQSLAPHPKSLPQDFLC